MTRSEALGEFKDRYMGEREQVCEAFRQKLEAGMDEVMKRMLEAFERIAKQAGEQQKYGCVHFSFSLLRYELTKGRALFRLDVMNAGWVLDEAPLDTELELTFLFTPFFEWKERLLLAMREYMGKVNKYDVEYLVQEELLKSSQVLTHMLRFAFRSIESQESFAKIPKLPFWNIRLGEYRDYSEVILQVNREPRSTEEWLDRLERYEEEPEYLNAVWWYRCTFTEGDCHEKEMYFTVFEECDLKGIDFSKAKMAGARFLNCRLVNCNFQGTDLSRSEFEQCVIDGCTFAGANLELAVFTPEGLEEEWFNEKQRAEMLIVLPEEVETAIEGRSV